jgi:hypothetical protein
MMEAADHGRLDDPALVEALHQSRLWRILLQGEVGPDTVVVGKVVAQQATQVGLVEHHDVVEHSRRTVPMKRSTYGFCQGERGAAFTSRIPRAWTRLENTTP